MADILDSINEEVYAEQAKRERLPFLHDFKNKQLAEYLMKVELTATGGSQRGQTPWFKVNMEVVEAKALEGTPNPPHAVGTRVSHMIRPDEYGYFTDDIMRIASILTGINLKELRRSDIDEMNEGNTGAGKLIRVRVAPKDLEDAESFVRVTFRSAD